MSQQTIKMYGAPWCPDCRRAKQFFGDQRVLYDWINVDDNPDSMKYVEQVNGDKQIISTIVFENGSVLEASRLALVGVADDGLGLTGCLRHRSPLPSGGEYGAASSHQATVSDLLDHLVGAHVANGALQGLVAAAAPVSLDARAPWLPYAGEDALLTAPGVGGGQGRGTVLQRVHPGAHQNTSVSEDGNGLVAAPGARHPARALGGEIGDQLIGASQRADRPGADFGRGAGRLLPRKVMVETDRAEEIGDGDAQCRGDLPDGGVGDELVSIVESVE